jgi:prepilin-type N-terminal cleavage/methylation domain-containing protein
MWKDERGFTLLEIIIALTIFAGGIVTVITMYSGGSQLGHASEKFLRGAVLAHHKMSELEMSPLPTGPQEGNFGNDGYQWRVNVEPYETPLNNEDENIQLAQVTLDVFWQDSGEEKVVQLTSLKTMGTHYPAADSVLMSSATIQSGTGNVAPTGTGTNTPAAPGTVSAPAGAPNPAVQPGFRFDISGFPVNPKQSGTPIGITGGQ